MHPLALPEAERIAIEVLGWLASDDERLTAFLGASGADLADLRQSAADPAFLGFVLDFLLQDEASVLAAAEALRFRPEIFQRARAGLPGGDLPNWT